MGTWYDDLIAEKLKFGGYDRHHGQSFSGFTGTMAAGLGAGSTVGAIRYPADAVAYYLPRWMHLHFTCINSFTTPQTAGRRLALRRGASALVGSSGNPSGGTALDIMRDLSTPGGNGSYYETLLVGQIANTGALTMPASGFSYATEVRARMMLVACGQQGQDWDEIWQLEGFALAPGEIAGLVATQAFDAGGTWQLNWKGWGLELRP